MTRVKCFVGFPVKHEEPRREPILVPHGDLERGESHPPWSSPPAAEMGLQTVHLFSLGALLGPKSGSRKGGCWIRKILDFLVRVN